MTICCENYLDLLKIDPEKTPVIAVVGGGGKTSLIFRLVGELAARGKRAAVTTTTHMAFESERPFALDGREELVKKNLSEYGYTVAAGFQEDSGKLCSLTEDRLLLLRDWCDVLLVESDGSRGLPLKMPAVWEPVIPPIADLVIGVAGLDCLGKAIGKTAHRAELVSEFLKKSPDDPVTPEDVAKIAGSVRGLRKDVGNRAYRVYLNKADVLADLSPAQEIAEQLAEQKVAAVWGCLRK